MSNRLTCLLGTLFPYCLKYKVLFTSFLLIQFDSCGFLYWKILVSSMQWVDELSGNGRPIMKTCTKYGDIQSPCTEVTRGTSPTQPNSTQLNRYSKPASPKTHAHRAQKPVIAPTPAHPETPSPPPNHPRILPTNSRRAAPDPERERDDAKE